VIPYKGKYRGEEFGNALHARSAFSVNPNGHITTEDFCKVLHHFNYHRLFGRALLNVDWRQTHLHPSVLIEVKKLNAQLVILSSR
jgi:hypothetical protein